MDIGKCLINIYAFHTNRTKIVVPGPSAPRRHHAIAARRLGGIQRAVRARHQLSERFIAPQLVHADAEGVAQPTRQLVRRGPGEPGPQAVEQFHRFGGAGGRA
jgi:hypothetical protein